MMLRLRIYVLTLAVTTGVAVIFSGIEAQAGYLSVDMFKRYLPKNGQLGSCRILLDRVSTLNHPNGVIVKVSEPGQSLRMDVEFNDGTRGRSVVFNDSSRLPLAPFREQCAKGEACEINVYEVHGSEKYRVFRLFYKQITQGGRFSLKPVAAMVQDADHSSGKLQLNPSKAIRCGDFTGIKVNPWSVVSED